jgi:hypothetical protein
MTKLLYNILIFTILIQATAVAQSNNLFFDLTGGAGRLVPHHPEMKNLAGPVTFLNARLGLKTMGKKEWQRVYNYPEIGIGISHNYLTKSFLGNPSALYSFMDLPLLPESKLKLRMGLLIGFAWGFHPYCEQNQENIVIGSECAAYASINFNSSFRICSDFDILFSVGGYHYSNGNLTKPNKGINMLGAETGLRYTVPGSGTKKNMEPVLNKKKGSSLMVFLARGQKKEITSGQYYSVGSVSTGYYRTISHTGRLNAGFDMFYDEGVLAYTQKEKVPGNVLAFGLFGGHELTIDKFSVVAQVGIYLKNPHPNDPFYYERLGIRYTIAGRIIPSLSLIAHGLKIDFVEWGLGFVLWRNLKM